MNQILWTSIIIIFHLLLFGLTLFTMAILVEKYIIVLIQKLSIKYNLSEQSSGYLLAITSVIPEFSTNLLTCLSKDRNLFKLGTVTIVGSGTYDLTICMSISSLFINYSESPEGLKIDKSIFMRNSLTYLLTLAFLHFILRDNIVNIYEAVILCLLFPLFIYINKKFEKTKENQTQITEIIGISNDNENKIENPQNISEQNNDKKKDSDKNLENFDTDASIQSKSIFEVKRSFPQKASDLISKILTKYLNLLEKIITLVFNTIIPINLTMALSFIVVAVLTYLLTKTIIYCVEIVSFFSGISALFLGITLVTWANNVGDTISACVLSKISNGNLLISGLFGTQILNLQFCLGFPWLISILTSPQQQIRFENSVDFKYFIISFVLVLLVILTFSITRVKLNKLSAALLTIIYIIYLAFEYNY